MIRVGVDKGEHMATVLPRAREKVQVVHARRRTQTRYLSMPGQAQSMISHANQTRLGQKMHRVLLVKRGSSSIVHLGL